jgi:hypothetical protein
MNLENSQKDLFTRFPRLKNPEIWIRILHFLGLPYIAHFAQVSRFCFYISETDKVWRVLYQQHFGEICNEVVGIDSKSEPSNLCHLQSLSNNFPQSTTQNDSVLIQPSIKTLFRWRKLGVLKV